MDLRVLRSFVTVCRLGNITRAAERLFISQPALTRQIKELEEELGCKLLNRNTRSVSLTENGFQFLVRAEEILSIAQIAKEELSENNESLRGIVRIGIVESKVMNFLSDHIAEFHRLYPHVRFEIYSGDGDDLRRSVDENKMDFALLIEPVESAKYHSIQVPIKERWGIVVPKDTYPISKNSVTGKELAKFPLFLPHRNIVLDEIKTWLHIEEKDLNIIGYQNLLSNILELIQRNMGAALCIEGAFTNRAHPDLRFLPLIPERCSSHVAIRKKNRNLTRPAELLWQQIKEQRSSSES